jgi:hypothetical protein
MAFTEYYVDAASSGGDGTTNATSGPHAAWATLSAAVTAIGAGPASVPTRINVKAGTYASGSSTLTFNTSGAAAAPVWWRGYKASIGDQDANNLAVAGTDIPSITFTTGAFSVTGNRQIFSNLDISGATIGSLLGVSGLSCWCYRLRAKNTAANSSSRAALFNGNTPYVVACNFNATATASSAVLISGTANVMVGCIITGGIIGVSVSSSPCSLRFCVIDSPAGDAISVATAVGLYCSNCSIYAPGGHGIVLVSTLAQGSIENCYFENVNRAGKIAINNNSGAASDLLHVLNNVYYNCTTPTSGLGDWPLIFDQGTLGSAGFVAPGSQNFALNSSAQGLAFPGKFENTSVYTGSLSNGAVQPAAGAGGVGSLVGGGLVK